MCVNIDEYECMSIYENAYVCMCGEGCICWMCTVVV